MPLTLNKIAGFADLPDSVLAAEHPVLGLHLARISNNATFGLVRTEVFTAAFHHGDSVPLPVSPVDGYAYSRNELLYFWVPQNTANPKTGWASGQAPWTMWYGIWNVDQTSGLVESIIGYRGNDDHPERQLQTNDGTLQVWTVAQRQKTGLVLGASPTASDVGDAAFYTDRALNTGLITAMNNNAKFGVLNMEVIYMGEFSDGGTVPAPVSPADSYAYNRVTEVTFLASWRWTADGTTAPVVPLISEGQLQDFKYTISSVGAVTVKVNYRDSFDSHGRIAVFAFCVRASAITAASSLGDFAEIDDVTFSPGRTLRASTMLVLNRNIVRATITPEFFFHTGIVNGNTIALPTSPLDGYTYTRDELLYIWTWKQTGPGTDRMDLIRGFISPTTGLVSLDVYRFYSGFSSESLTHDGSLDVMVIGMRGRETTFITPTPVNPPGGAGGTGTFDSSTPTTVISQPDATHLDTAAFVVDWSDGLETSYNSRAFSISDPGTAPQTYYVTIYDPTGIGDSAGTLTSFCDTNATRARTAGYVFAGKIIATHAAGGTGSVVGPAGIDQVLVTVG